jgi:hypothetical protein
MMNTHPTSGNQSARPSGPRHSRFLAWLEARLQATGDYLFRADDTLAESNGWEVSAGRWGLSRTYRDQRFNRRSALIETRVVQQ